MKTINILKYIFLVSSVMSILIPAKSWAESPDDLLIIGNNMVAESDLVPADAKNIFLKKRASWSNGDTIIPINANKGTPLREAFLNKVLKMAKTEEDRYWEEQKIKKGITPPMEIMNTLKGAGSQKGAVSYIFRKDFKAGQAKILATF